MKYYIYCKTNKTKYYYESYTDALSDYQPLMKRLGVYPSAIFLGCELSKEYAFLTK